MLVEVDSPDDPRLEPYRHLKTTNRTRISGEFIAEGHRVVERLIRSDFVTASVLVSRRRLDDLPGGIPEHVPVYVLEQDAAAELVGFNFHAGMLACGIRRPPAAISTVVPQPPRRCLLVACPHVTHPDNLGAVVRICAAFGATALLIGERSADPFSRRVLRVSMGTALSLPIVESRSILRDLAWLRDEADVQLLATVLADDAVRLDEVSPPERVCLLFGNEAEGLRPDEIAHCPRRITLPMQGGTDSLNVAVAAGIFLYHFSRDRAARRPGRADGDR